MHHTDTTFGNLLSSWRNQRGFSQLSLALESAVSQRHISFLESGRSTPSRNMVLRLSETLCVPLEQRNTLLFSAGFAPVFQERKLSSDHLEPVRSAADALLEGVEPAPSFIVDGCWQLISTNTGAVRFFSYVLGQQKFADLFLIGEPVNVLKLFFDADGLKPFIDEWDYVASAVLQRLHRDAASQGKDGPIAALLADILKMPGLPSTWRKIVWDLALPPSMVMTFLAQGNRLSFLATITTIGTPYDITLDGLRIETFFPADNETRLVLTKLSENSDM